jgi:P27 family predicted phage terminase small subunit
MPPRKNPKHMRLVHGEDRPAVRTPSVNELKPPRWMPKQGRDEWRRVLEMVKQYPGWITTADIPTLTAYCSTWTLFVDASKDVADRGHVVPARSSTDRARDAMVKNPSVQIARDAAASLRRWITELGFSPLSRGSLDVPQLEQDLDQMLVSIIDGDGLD